jgi:hypothetical protein
MKKTLITIAIRMALRLLTPEAILDWIKSFRDYIEDKVRESETQIDDMIILPLLDMIESSPDISATFVTAFTDFAEAKIKDSDTEDDDAILLPLLDALEIAVKK